MEGGGICFFIISSIFQSNESGHMTRKLRLEHSLGARYQLAWSAHHTYISVSFFRMQVFRQALPDHHKFVNFGMAF